MIPKLANMDGLWISDQRIHAKKAKGSAFLNVWAVHMKITLFFWLPQQG